MKCKAVKEHEEGFTSYYRIYCGRREAGVLYKTRKGEKLFKGHIHSWIISRHSTVASGVAYAQRLIDARSRRD